MFIKNLFCTKRSVGKPLLESTALLPDLQKKSQQTDSNDSPVQFNFTGNQADDLMRLIAMAIDLWVSRYHMEHVPRKLIFQQALSMMNAMNSISKHEE